MDGGVGSGVVNEDYVCGFLYSVLLWWMMAKREYFCHVSFYANWVSVRVLRSSVCDASLVMRRSSKNLARVLLRYMPLSTVCGTLTRNSQTGNFISFNLSTKDTARTKQTQHPTEAYTSITHLLNSLKASSLLD